MARMIYKTRFGDFAVRNDCVHGVSIYKASRTGVLGVRSHENNNETGENAPCSSFKE
jgi:hypothetical protein